MEKTVRHVRFLKKNIIFKFIKMNMLTKNRITKWVNSRIDLFNIY